MPQQDYNRYSILKNGDGTIDNMPFIKIPEFLSDKYERWNLGFSRMDKLSKKYYGNPFYDFFILMANPEHINEFDIPDNVVIRIPFPLDSVKSYFESELQRIKNQ